jgi:prepilin-type N-terminal cleavage/methylation domain-containing protein
MKFRKPKTFTSQTGMSLLEIMVSLSILAVTFIALMQSFPLTLSINKTSENATKASYLAQEKLEELNSLGYGNIAVGTIETKHRLSSAQNNYLYYFQRQTLVNYVDGNLQDSVSDTGLKKISVTIYYTNALSKTEKNYSTVTLISQW